MIDWQDAYARLDGARRALETHTGLPPEEAQRILDERARRFARPLEPVSFPADALELLVFSLGAERYGIETACVVDVLRFAEPTRVPCTPPFVRGVVNHRGRMVPALDLERLLGRAGGESAAASRIVTVEAAGVTFGIVATVVAGTVRVAADGLAPRAPAAAGGGPSPFRGVTPDMVAVLDVDALVRDPRIVVNEEVR